MLAFLQAHPTECLAVALAVLNLLGRLAGDVKNPVAAKALAVAGSLGPDLVGVVKALVPTAKAPDAK